MLKSYIEQNRVSQFYLEVYTKMLRKYLAVMALALVATPLFADVELQTSINDVFNRGSNELAGSITMTVNDDDFKNASTLEPIFIRITLDHNARLAETLVDQGLPASDYRSLPIFLAMELNSTADVLTMEALTETVSIVRWVEGEPRFWIRVQSPSDTWIGTPAGTQGPTEDALVSWQVGISARLSADDNDDPTKSNLPFNTRIPSTTGDTDDAASTLICVDLSGSNLATTGIESELKFDPIAFDENADLGGGVYSGQSGNDTGIDFTDDRVIARGKSRSCDVIVNDIFKNVRAIAPLCVPAGAENDGIIGLVKATNLIQFTVTCDSGAEFIETGLFDGAFVRYENNTDFEYGFRFTSDVSFGTTSINGSDVVFTANNDGFGAFVPGTNFNTHGSTLYSAIDLVWDGGTDTPLNSRTFTVQVCVWQHYLEPPTQILLDWEVWFVNHDGARDLEDNLFDGNSAFGDGTVDQDRRCNPSQFLIYEDTWDFGDFVPCDGVPVVIFFPYAPKLFESSFWVGLSYVNQGAATLDVEAIFYMENGDRFAATLPSIAPREQYTWVIGEDELGTVGLTGVGANNDGEVAIPLPSGNAPADSFGTTRMSMFVRGTFEAEFLDDVFNGDLDGYLLIGSRATGSVDGAYLPRNYDNDIPNQNADLPISRSKRADGRNLPIEGDEPARYQFDKIRD